MRLYHRLTYYAGAIILRELSQTSHVGGGLRPRDKGIVERTASKSQKVLKKTNGYRKEQVDVELFNLYAIRKCSQKPWTIIDCLDANINP